MAEAESSPHVIDVAIVGGGVSGVYAAYRLKHAERESTVTKGPNFLGDKKAADLDIVLYEQSDRIGGRLWSLTPPGWNQGPIELGGMGFSKLHQSVYELCAKELGLEIVPCGFFNNPGLQYFRGKHFATTEYAPTYDLAEGEKDKMPAEIMVGALLSSVTDGGQSFGAALGAIKSGDLSTGFTAMREMTEKLRQAYITGNSACSDLPLHSVGFWNLLADVLSIEAFHLCTDSSFSPSYNFNWNSYDSLQSLLNVVLIYTLFGTKDLPFSRLKNGYQELPDTMAAKFIDKGGVVNTNMALRTIRRAEVDGESVLKLTFASTNGQDWERVYARSAILAMPKRAIELLDEGNILHEGEHFAADMSAVSGIALSKVYTIYKSPWWNNLPRKITTGFSTTDLPMKAAYYVNGDKGEENENGVLLASFSDDRYVQFWEGYIQPTKTEENLQWHVTPDGVSSTFRVPDGLIREIQKQVRELHGNDPAIEEPTGSLIFNWGQDPYGGGYHCWHPHFKSWEIMPRIRKPVRDANVFICGEAFSATQGWVEGAINTAEKLVEDHFGLARPDWVDPEYSFGP